MPPLPKPENLAKCTHYSWRSPYTYTISIVPYVYNRIKYSSHLRWGPFLEEAAIFVSLINDLPFPLGEKYIENFTVAYQI